jgi:hypothetical protein
MLISDTTHPQIIESIFKALRCQLEMMSHMESKKKSPTDFEQINSKIKKITLEYLENPQTLRSF